MTEANLWASTRPLTSNCVTSLGCASWFWTNRIISVLVQTEGIEMTMQIQSCFQSSYISYVDTIIQTVSANSWNITLGNMITNYVSLFVDSIVPLSSWLCSKFGNRLHRNWCSVSYCKFKWLNVPLVTVRTLCHLDVCVLFWRVAAETLTERDCTDVLKLLSNTPKWFYCQLHQRRLKPTDECQVSLSHQTAIRGSLTLCHI